MKSTTTTTRKSRSTATSPVHAHAESSHSHNDRMEHIAVSAYYKAQARGFAPGRELEDWLQAEAELTAASPRI